MTLRIRTRLTIWYTSVFFLLLGVYIAAVLAFQYEQLRDQIYRNEVQETEAVEGLLYFTGDGQLHVHDEYYSHSQSRLLVDRLLEIHDTQGNVLFRSNSLGTRELGRPSYPKEGSAWFESRDVRLSVGTRALVTSHLHPVAGRMLLIRLGYDLQPLNERIRRFVYLLLLALPPSLLLAALAGYRLSRAAFTPLERMASRAEQITASRLHERLSIATPSDEPGRMGLVINELLERLQQAFSQLQRFTADVAHELRTPLTALRALGEEALTTAPNRAAPESAIVIGNMLEEAERLTQTIDGLLLLSRAEVGSPTLAATSFRLTDLVDEVVALLDVLLEERGIAVYTGSTGEGDGIICADRVLIRSALLNVFHNAVKYSRPHSTIRVLYVQKQVAGQHVQQVCIEDQGPGLASGEHARIFERFYRGSAQSDSIGAGLGLSIARLAVEHSGGTIFADESYTGGLRCCLSLPIATAALEPPL